MELAKKHNFYLIKFSNGLVKVGIGNVRYRITTHKSTASIFDVHLEKEFTDNVTNPRLVEQYMIKHLGANCSGIRAKEWFKDADYDNALAYFETIKDVAEFAVKPIKSAEAMFVDVVQHYCSGAATTDLKPFKDATEKQTMLYNAVKDNNHLIEILGENRTQLLALCVVGVCVTDWDIEWAIDAVKTTSEDDALDFLLWAILETHKGIPDAPKSHSENCVNVLAGGFEWMFQ